MILKYCVHCKTYITDDDPFNFKGVCSLCGKVKIQPSKEDPTAASCLYLMGFGNPDEEKPWVLRPLNDEKEKETQNL